MAFSVENLVPVSQDKEGQTKSSGNWSVDNLVPVASDSSGKTPYDQFSEHQGSIDVFKPQIGEGKGNGSSSIERDSDSPKNPQGGQPKDFSKDVQDIPAGIPGHTFSYPFDQHLNAVFDAAIGSTWNTFIKPVTGQDNKYVDAYLKHLDQEHPLSSVIGGMAPFIATAPLIPEGLIGLKALGYASGQFAAISTAQAIGEARTTGKDKSLGENVKDVSIAAGEGVLGGALWHYTSALSWLPKALSRAVGTGGIALGADAVHKGGVTEIWGDNLSQAFKQAGIIGALSLVFENPILAKSPLFRGIAANSNEYASKKEAIWSTRQEQMQQKRETYEPGKVPFQETVPEGAKVPFLSKEKVKLPIINPDEKDENKLKQSILDMAKHMSGDSKQLSNPRIVAATVIPKDGEPSHGASHSDALAKIDKKQYLTHEEAMSELGVDDKGKPVGDSRITVVSSSGRIGRGLKETGLEGLRPDTVNEVKQLADNNDLHLTITGGTEKGHIKDGELTHDQGNKVDLRLEDKLNKTIESWGDTKEREVNGRIDKGYVNPNTGATYWKEGNHWDVEVPMGHQEGFTVMNPDGSYHFITREQSKKPPFNLPTGHSSEVPGLNESKFTKDPKPLTIVNPNTLESQSGDYSPTDYFQYVHNKPLSINFGKNDKATSKSLRLEYAGIKNEQIVRGNQLADKIKRLVPDLEERQAIFWYKAAEGNTDFMLEMLSEDAMKPYRNQIKKAFNLSPKAMKALEMINQYYEESGQVALELGTIRDVRENYQNRIYKPEPPQDYVKNEIKKGLKQTTSHAKRRVYDNEFDAVMGGKEFATTDVADSLSIHNEEMARVNTSRKLADAMVENKLGAWKRPDNIPEGWEQVGTISKSVPLKNDKGEPVIGEDGNQMVSKSVFVAPKGIVEGLKAIVEPNYVSRIDSLRNIQKYQGIVKTVDLSLSFFHHFTMAAQVLYQGGIRTFMSLPNMNRMIESESFAEMEKDMVRNGGITSKVEANQDVLRKLVEHDGSMGSKIENLPGIKQYLNVTEKMSNFLFGKIQRYLKVMDYNEKVSKWASKNLEATNEEVLAAKQGIAKEVNAAYGGLNWEAMGITKSNLSLLRLGLLAPDWTLSNVELLKYALGDKGTSGSLSRKHILTALIGGMVLTEGLNQLLTGHTTDKNKKGHALEVEIAPNVYVSFLRGGIGDISKFTSMVMESGLGGVSRFAQGKMSPFARTLIGLLNNVQYTGRAIVKKGEGPVVGTYHVMSYLLANAGPIPFGIGTTALQYSTDPNKTLTGGLAVGMGIARYSKSKASDEPKEMTPYRRRQLERESKLDPIEKKTRHLSFDKLAEMVKNSSDEDKPELQRILEKRSERIKKMRNWSDHDEKLYQQSFGQ